MTVCQTLAFPYAKRGFQSFGNAHLGTNVKRIIQEYSFVFFLFFDQDSNLLLEVVLSLHRVSYRYNTSDT